MKKVVMVCQRCNGETTFSNCTAKEADGRSVNCAVCGHLVLMKMVDIHQVIGTPEVAA